MAVVPFRWCGPARHARIAQSVEVDCVDWLREWAMSADRIATVVGPCELGDALRNWQCWTSAHGTLRIDLSAGLAGTLGNLLAGVAGDRTMELPQRLGQRALDDLARVVLGADATRAPAGTAAASEHLHARRGTAALRISLGALDLDCVLDATACDRVAPVTRDTGGLVARASALAASDVALDAVLDLGATSLQHVRNIRPGEIIKTDRRLDTPLLLRTADGRSVAEAVLVDCDGQRGLRVASLSSASTNRGTP